MMNVLVTENEVGARGGETPVFDPNAPEEAAIKADDEGPDMFMVVGLSAEGGLFFDSGDLPLAVAQILLQQAVLQLELSAHLVELPESPAPVAGD